MTFAHVLPMALSCVLAYTTSSAPGSIFRSPRAPGYELVKGMWVARQFFFRAPLVFRGTPRGIRTFRGIHYFKRLAIKWLGELTTDQMTAVDKWPLSSSTSSMADFFLQSQCVNWATFKCEFLLGYTIACDESDMLARGMCKTCTAAGLPTDMIETGVCETSGHSQWPFHRMFQGHYFQVKLVKPMSCNIKPCIDPRLTIVKCSMHSFAGLLLQHGQLTWLFQGNDHPTDL